MKLALRLLTTYLLRIYVSSATVRGQERHFWKHGMEFTLVLHRSSTSRIWHCECRDLARSRVLGLTQSFIFPLKTG